MLGTGLGVLVGGSQGSVVGNLCPRQICFARKLATKKNGKSPASRLLFSPHAFPGVRARVNTVIPHRLFRRGDFEDTSTPCLNSSIGGLVPIAIGLYRKK